MNAFAQFIMRGRFQAALVVSAAALLSLVLPLFGLISSAAVALVTLRNGAKEGASVVAIATLACAVIAGASLGVPLVAAIMMLLFWLPMLGLGAVLRHSRSLATTMQAGVLVGIALVLLIRLLVDDPAAAWLVALRPLEELLAQDSVVEPEAAQALLAEIAKWMTGAFAAGLVLQWLVSLFVSRWWQALLYNPGGFGEEFRSLRLSRWVGIGGLLVLAFIGFQRGPGPFSDLLILLSVLWLLQGLAVVHALHHDRRLAVGWLVGFYVVLVLSMPHAELLVACVGLVDIWTDIRARLISRPSAPGG